MNLRPAIPPDLWDLSKRLRACDLREIALGSGKKPEDALVAAWHSSSLCEAICTDNGVVAGVWGVAPTELPGIGSIWMLASDEIESVALPFLRACESAVRRTGYTVLVCNPSRANALHLRWLDWLGFRPIGRGDKDFQPFIRHV